MLKTGELVHRSSQALSAAEMLAVRAAKYQMKRFRVKRLSLYIVPDCIRGGLAPRSLPAMPWAPSLSASIPNINTNSQWRDSASSAEWNGLWREKHIYYST